MSFSASSEVIPIFTRPSFHPCRKAVRANDAGVDNVDEDVISCDLVAKMFREVDYHRVSQSCRE